MASNTTLDRWVQVWRLALQEYWKRIGRDHG